MALIFYPNPDDVMRDASLHDRIDLLMGSAERYKAIVLDAKVKELPKEQSSDPASKLLSPRDIPVAYNWDEIAQVLRAIRHMSESDKLAKAKKADLLIKLAEVYEVLRSAKLAKLEAVRLALMTEANQLRGSGSQVA